MKEHPSSWVDKKFIQQGRREQAAIALIRQQDLCNTLRRAGRLTDFDVAELSAATAVYDGYTKPAEQD